MLPIKHTEDVLNTIRQKSDSVILFYSAGKDSIALLDLLSKKFEKVVVVFMYFVKDLEHTGRFLTFSARNYSNIEIIEVPHWCLTYIHKQGLYCAPNPKIKLLKLNDIVKSIRLRTGLQYVVLGMKQADNMNRRLMLRNYENEAISDTKLIYPLSKWKDADVLRYIKNNKLPRPISYGGHNRSNGVGFDLDVFLYLKKYYPRDLIKILKAYPLSAKILFDHEQKIKK